MKKLTLTLLLVGGIAGSAFGYNGGRCGRDKCAKPCEKKCAPKCAPKCTPQMTVNHTVSPKPCCVEQVLIEREVQPLMHREIIDTFSCPALPTCRTEAKEYQVKKTPQMLHAEGHILNSDVIVSDRIAEVDADSFSKVEVDSFNS